MTDHHHDCHGHGCNKSGVGLCNALVVAFGLLVAFVLAILDAKFLFLAIAKDALTFDVLVEGFKMAGISMATTFGALIYNRLCGY